MMGPGKMKKGRAYFGETRIPKRETHFNRHEEVEVRRARMEGRRAAWSQRGKTTSFTYTKRVKESKTAHAYRMKSSSGDNQKGNDGYIRKITEKESRRIGIEKGKNTVALQI